MTHHYDENPNAFELALARFYEAEAAYLRQPDGLIGTDAEKLKDLAFEARDQALDALYETPAHSVREAALKIRLYMDRESGALEPAQMAFFESIIADLPRIVAGDRAAWAPTEAERAQGVTPMHARAAG